MPPDSIPPPKRRRRTNDELAVIRDAIENVLTLEHPMSVRQMFYNLVELQVIAKTDTEYTLIKRCLTDMRHTGRIPFEWVVDSTRRVRRPLSHATLADAFDYYARTFRQALWTNAVGRIQVWCESEAIVNVIEDITSGYDVHLVAFRGDSSLSLLNDVATDLRNDGRPVHVLYLGDHDPEGRDIPRVALDFMRKWAPDVEISFERVAITREQIIERDLPTAPVKTGSPRAKRFEGGTVQLEALKPHEIRELLKAAFDRFINHSALDSFRAREEGNRTVLKRAAQQLREFANTDDDTEDDE